jgi:hypothetical protein
MRSYRPEIWLLLAFGASAAVLGVGYFHAGARAPLLEPTLAVACGGAVFAALSARRARALLSPENFPFARFGCPALTGATVLALVALVRGSWKPVDDLGVLLLLAGGLLALGGLLGDADRRPAVLGLVLAAQVWMVMSLTRPQDPRKVLHRTYATVAGAISRFLGPGFTPSGADSTDDSSARRNFKVDTLKNPGRQ